MGPARLPSSPPYALSGEFSVIFKDTLSRKMPKLMRRTLQSRIKVREYSSGEIYSPLLANWKRLGMFRKRGRPPASARISGGRR
jgi:hypothetical protein